MGDLWREGGFEITCLTDGGTVFAPEVFGLGADSAGIGTEFNAFLIRDTQGALTLVDTGCGDAFGAAGGRLAALLEARGIAPERIERLIFTHLHSDHCGGALADGALRYPRAEVVMHPEEARYWSGQDHPAARVLTACAGRLRLSEGPVAEGLELWPLPGHTPGHSGLRIGAGLVLVGDIVHSEALQLPDPAVSTCYDVATDQARASRIAALAEVADRRLVWSGGHVLGPDKFARLERHGAGYAKVPA